MKSALSFLKTLSTLQLALGISVAVHAALLTVRFVDPERFNRVFQDTPLEVILVNARSDGRPDKATAIAQASLAGGGDKERGRATSPLPPAAVARIGDAHEDDERKIEQLREQQNRLLAQVRRELAKMPPPDPESVTPSPDASEREQRRRALVKILAEIEKRISEENARPKKRYISPATREAVYAIYYDGLRRKIEDRGTSNFPEAGGRKLYGELTMIITVNHNGAVLDTEVVQPSGIALLDRRAQAIVHSLAFGNFSDAMRRQADQIVVVSRFRFTREETLQTQLSGQ
ncbi:MAG: energy transducer TonB [Hydrogenophaga sp.]|jgi:periplasmic protein TonB|uniref:energy transducer TonB n=1 Tax=Hydrogenophaga sp. TaxID=1904254 RepID=UPI00262EF53D|nr:energy transducer TonB [Hydrogenophaga sp.]MCV0438204.1 energy transducer TonB [Hydrogenophaga sp.]